MKERFVEIVFDPWDFDNLDHAIKFMRDECVKRVGYPWIDESVTIKLTDKKKFLLVAKLPLKTEAEKLKEVIVKVFDYVDTIPCQNSMFPHSNMLLRKLEECGLCLRIDGNKTIIEKTAL